jgi:selT/selW/selH-like putative selenoprotein
MVRNFRSLQEFLEVRYPEFRGQIQGGNYPPPSHAVIATQVAQLAQWSIIILMFGGDALFQAMGIIQHPEWYTYIKENKMSTFIGVFFANSVAQSMTATGAFEVAVDGHQIYSKLATGRMPTAGDLVTGLAQLGINPIED